MPSLCGSAEATREWFRAFTAHSFLACRPLRPRGVRHRYPDIRCRHWPSPIDQRLGTPDTPAIRFTRAVDFVASLVRFRYSLPGCSPPCTDQTGMPSLRGLLLPGFQRIGLPPRCLDITTTATDSSVGGGALTRWNGREPRCTVNHYRNAMAASCLLSLRQHSGSVLMHCSKF